MGGRTVKDRLSRRRFLQAALAGALTLPGAARAIGPGSNLRIGDLTLGGVGGSRRGGLAQLGTYIRSRTSIEVDRENPQPAQAGTERLFETPMLWLSADRRFGMPSTRELASLRRHLTFGGFLVIDSAEGRAGGEVDASVRRLVAELFPAPHPGLVPVDPDHVIYKSFYLLRTVAGRLAVADRLEQVVLGGRTAIVYSQNDLGGAWMKDELSNWMYQTLHPGGEMQREHAFRLGVNLVMYALCLDYKTDQVHIPFILKRRRWRVD
jgi:hypothetical protein